MGRSLWYFLHPVTDMRLKTIFASYIALGGIATSCAYASPVEFSAAITASGPSQGITIIPEQTQIDATYTVTGDDVSGYSGSFTGFAQPATFLIKSKTGGELPALDVKIHSPYEQYLGAKHGIPVVTQHAVTWGYVTAYNSINGYTNSDGTGDPLHPADAMFVTQYDNYPAPVRYLPPDGAMTAPMNTGNVQSSYTPLTNAKPQVSVTSRMTLNNNNGPALEFAATGYGYPTLLWPASSGASSLRVGLTAYATVEPVTSVGALVNGFALSVPGTLTVTPM